ncbi:MAG: MFS transporter [Chloroflexota bacterium]
MTQIPPETIPEEETAAPESVFRNRNFMLLWAAQAISQTAQNAIWFGLMVVVEEATRSSTQMGFAVLTTILPSILLGMVAGVLVDRMRKRSVLVATNALRALVVLGFLLYDRALLLVYGVNLVSATITQFFAPAEASKIPQLVSKRQLLTANSLFNLTFNASQLAGMVILGPPVVKLFGPSAVFVGSAAAFGVACALVYQLPREPAPERGLRGLDSRAVMRDVWVDVVEGWRFITTDRFTTLAMLHLTMASALMLIVAMLAPRYVVAVLSIRAEDAVYILAPAGLGILAGTSLMGRLVRRFSKETLVNTGLVIMSVFIFLLSTVGLFAGTFLAPAWAVPGLQGGSSVVALVMFIALVLGGGLSLIIIPSQTILMERAPSDTRGRIFAVQIVLGHVASIAPLMFMGGLADLIGIERVIALLAAGVLMVWFVSTGHFAARLTSRRKA